MKCLSDLKDADLLSEVRTLAAHERQTTAHLIAALAELDARRLYLGEGCSSLFAYCTQVLHLSEHAAYGRIEAARATRRFPIILDFLLDGSLTLTSVCLLTALLTPDNHRETLDAARHKTKREVEHLVADLRPQPAVPATVRKMPTTEILPNVDLLTGSAAPVKPVLDVAARPAPPPIVKPIAPERYKVQFTLSRDGYDNLRQAQDLLRHVIPNGDVATIFERALSLLVDDLRRRKLADVGRSRRGRASSATSRHIPAAVRREVWMRDEGQCAFKGSHGRCGERGFLEFHHVVPYADGGLATAGNIELRCRAHNAYEAEQYFGPLFARERQVGYSVPDRVVSP